MVVSLGLSGVSGWNGVMETDDGGVVEVSSWSSMRWVSFVSHGVEFSLAQIFVTASIASLTILAFAMNVYIDVG